MIKRFIRHLYSIKAFLAVARDPTRTDQAFVVITDPLIINKQSFDVILARLYEDPKNKSLIEQRYAGRWSPDELLTLPPGSLGHAFTKHIRDNNLDINFYPPVHGESVEAYIQLRIRQTHDIWHVMTGFDTSIIGEIGLQAFMQVQMHGRSPTILMTSALLHCCFYKPELLFEATRAMAHGWMMGEKAKPLFGERFEESWGKNLEQYRQEMGLPHGITAAESAKG